MICKAIQDGSITLPVDGSQDRKIAIKGNDPADISIDFYSTPGHKLETFVISVLGTYYTLVHQCTLSETY